MAVKIHLTKGFIESLASEPAHEAFARMIVAQDAKGRLRRIDTPNGTHDWIIRDTEQRGLLIRLTPGSTTWCVQRKMKGQKRLLAFGSLRQDEGKTMLGLVEARKRAEALIGLMINGIDPALERQERFDQATAARKRARYTFKVAYEEMIVAKAGKDAKGTQEDRKKVGRWLQRAPLFSMPFARVDKQAVHDTMHPLLVRAKGGKATCAWGPKSLSPGSFLKTYAYCSLAWKHGAGELGVETRSPFVTWRSEQKFPAVVKRETTFRTDDANGERWIRALVSMRDRAMQPDVLEHRAAVRSRGLKPHTAVLIDYYILVLIWGTRLTETCRLEWDSVDFGNRVIRLAPETTKSREVAYVPMTTWAEQLLLERRDYNRRWRPDEVQRFVFPSRRLGQPLADPRNILRTLNRLAGVKITTHDLRRVASTEMSRDIDEQRVARLVLAGAVLHHSQSRGGGISRATSGYLMRQADTVRPIYQEREDHLRRIAGLLPPAETTPAADEARELIARLREDKALRKQVVGALMDA